MEFLQQVEVRTRDILSRKDVENNAAVLIGPLVFVVMFGFIAILCLD